MPGSLLLAMCWHHALGVGSSLSLNRQFLRFELQFSPSTKTLPSLYSLHSNEVGLEDGRGQNILFFLCSHTTTNTNTICVCRIFPKKQKKQPILRENGLWVLYSKSVPALFTGR